MLFGGGKSLKVDPSLLADLAKAAEEDGYSSVEEMADHLLRNALQERTKSSISPPTEEERRIADEQLKGLGYLK